MNGSIFGFSFGFIIAVVLAYWLGSKNAVGRVTAAVVG